MQKNYGYVQDVCADLENGAITSIIVPGSSKILNLFTDAKRYCYTMGECKMHWRRNNFS